MKKSKKKKKKKSNTWKIKQHRDQFVKKSKTLGYRSRAAFKLIELNNKFKFINKNSYLLDIGAYPGGWAQVVSKIISTGKILSIDLQKIEEIKNVNFAQCNFVDETTKEKIITFFGKKLDVILSDMAADTTGNKSLDCIRTNQLCKDVIEFSTKCLKPKGVLISKIFMGEDFIEVKDFAKTKFKKSNFLNQKQVETNQKKLIYIARH